MIQLTRLTKTYICGEAKVNALRDVNLSISRGEFVAIMGASGSGKSTLLQIIGCLDQPTSGTLTLDGIATEKMTPDQLAEIRCGKISFVFQGFNLLSRTSAVENVELPLHYRRNCTKRESRKKALAMLSKVGLADRADHEPNQLSGGQQQRVAIARALVNDPGIVLADEPTGNLDTVSSNEIMELFLDMHTLGKTIILVTHEADIAQYAHRIIEMRDGSIIRDEATVPCVNGQERMVR